MSVAVGAPGEGRGQGYLFLLLCEAGICPGADDVLRATLPTGIRLDVTQGNPGMWLQSRSGSLIPVPL